MVITTSQHKLRKMSELALLTDEEKHTAAKAAKSSLPASTHAAVTSVSAECRAMCQMIHEHAKKNTPKRI